MLFAQSQTFWPPPKFLGWVWHCQAVVNCQVGTQVSGSNLPHSLLLLNVQKRQSTSMRGSKITGNKRRSLFPYSSAHPRKQLYRTWQDRNRRLQFLPHPSRGQPWSASFPRPLPLQTVPNIMAWLFPTTRNLCENNLKQNVTCSADDHFEHEGKASPPNLNFSIGQAAIAVKTLEILSVTRQPRTSSST